MRNLSIIFGAGQRNGTSKTRRRLWEPNRVATDKEAFRGHPQKGQHHANADLNPAPQLSLAKQKIGKRWIHNNSKGKCPLRSMSFAPSLQTARLSKDASRCDQRPGRCILVSGLTEKQSVRYRIPFSNTSIKENFAPLVCNHFIGRFTWKSVYCFS